jgi:hypothetical protein
LIYASTSVVLICVCFLIHFLPFICLFIRTQFVFFVLLFFVFSLHGQHIARLRYEDNFDYLLTDTTSRSWDERIKYLPFIGRSNVTFGGEIREQYQNYTHANFGQMPSSFTEESPHQWLHRMLLHTDIHVNKYVRIFAQLSNTYRFFNPNPIVSQVDQNLFSIHQFFGELSFNEHLRIRAGKQELLLGQERFIASREGPNNRQSFLGVDALYNASASRLHLFYLNPIKMNTGAFDDGLMDERIGGLYSAFNVLPKLVNLDAYYFNFTSSQRSYVLKNGLEARQTGGIRVFSPLRSLNFDFEFAYQWGTFNVQKINAWMLVWDVNKQLFPHGFAGFSGNFVPGDKSSADDALNTFNTLFARPPFGQTVALNITNTRNLSPYIRYQNGVKWLVTARASFVNRVRLADGVYTPNMSTLRPLEGANVSNNKDLCSIYALDFNYNTSAHLFTQAELGFCRAGDYLKESGSGKNVFYFAVRNAFRF